MKSCTFFVYSLLALLAPTLSARAQGGVNDPGGLTLPVGRTSAVLSATLTFTTATTPGSPFTINVLTMGSPNLDFNLAPGGTCSTTATYAVGATCTVDYTFSPLHPGARYGGISLTVGTTPLANKYLQGTGLGPQAAIVPPVQQSVGTFSDANQEFAIDGAGDLFVGEFFGSGIFGLLVEVPSGCTESSCTQTLSTLSDFSNSPVNAVTIDGSGNLYIAFYNPASDPHNVYEFPRGCFQRSCAIPLGDGIVEPWAVVVDPTGSGNVYVSAGYRPNSTYPNDGYIIEIPPGCASEDCIVPISEPFREQSFNLQIDNSGNLFFGGSGPESNPSLSATYEIPAGCKSSSCTLTFTGIGGFETTYATDSAGNLFVVHYEGVGGGGVIYDPTTYEFPAGCMDVSCSLIVPPNTFNWYLPRGELFNGNIYQLNNYGNAITAYDFSHAATVTFPATAQGQVSPVQTATLTNEGNEPLVFVPSITQPNPAISQYFQLDITSAGTCGALIGTSTTPSLAPTADCTLPLAFAPLAPALGTITGQSTVTDNSLNVPSSTQTVPLVGDSVLPGTTFLAFTSSINPVFARVGTTLTAQLTSPSGTPTGSVTFSDDSTVLATVALNSSGTAAYTATFATAGLHPLTATYTPTGIFLPSSASLSEQVNADTALAVLSATPNPANLGASVGLSVTLSGNPVGPTPTGTVTLTANGKALATSPIVNGLATLSTTTLPGGSNSLSCNYSGDSIYAADNCNTLVEVVSNVATTLTLTSSANPATPFGPLSFTATLTAAGVHVTGAQVTLTLNGTSLATGTTSARGIAVFQQQGGLAAGQYTVTATSSPYNAYESASASLIETVTPPAVPDFALTLTPPTLTVSPGQPGSTELTAQSVNGFTGPVTLRCVAPLPPSLTCAFDTTQLTLAANGSASTQLQINTTALALLQAPRSTTQNAIRLALFLPLLSLLSIRRRRNVTLFLLLTPYSLLLALLTGCNGGYATGTPPGSYSIVVSATSGTLTRTTTLPLIITR